MMRARNGNSGEAIRVMHLIDSGGLYGAEIILLTLMEAQKKMGLHPWLLSIDSAKGGPKHIEVECRERGFDTEVLRFKNVFDLTAGYAILKKAFEKNAQIIHSHGYKGNILVGLLPRRTRKIPILTTIHGWTSTRIFSKLGIYELADGFAMKCMDGVVAVSPSVGERRILKHLDIRPFVINNGIPLLPFPEGEFEGPFPNLGRLNNHQYLLLAIGRLSPEKGFSFLIRAISILVSRGIEAILIILGDGPSRDSIQHMIGKENLKERVFLSGYQPKAYRFMKHFDAFILPSLTEGFPVTILEAMQAEIPIVATAVGEIPLILEKGRLGAVVPPRDPQALARAIELTLIDQESAKRKASLARAKAMEEYTAEAMANKYKKVYEYLWQGGNLAGLPKCFKN